MAVVGSEDSKVGSAGVFDGSEMRSAKVVMSDYGRAVARKGRKTGNIRNKQGSCGVTSMGKW